MKVDREKIKRCMANACKTIGELCSDTGLSRSTVARVMSGRSEGCRPATIGKIAKALGVNVEELIILED